MSQSVWLPRIDRAACTGCRKCVEACPTHALAQVQGKAALVYPDLCTYCTACEDLCPTDAIELPYLVCKSNTSD
jgi:electron transport complex protein RnfB